MRISVDIELPEDDPQQFRLLRQVKARGKVVPAILSIVDLINQDPTRGSISVRALSS